MTTAELAKQSIPEAMLHPRGRMLAFRGSIAQGLYEGGPDSDFDLTGFYPAEASQYIGLGLDPEHCWEAKEGPWEAKYYEFRHMMQLLVKANPDLMQMLWTPKDAIIVTSYAADCLMASRIHFISKQVFPAFTGFANSQIERMTRIDWKRASDERRRMFQQYGYDTKNAMHTVRTVRMAIEMLRTGDMVMDRREAGDAAELLAIKHGDWSLESAKGLILTTIEEARRAHAESKLPETANMKAANELCVGLVRSMVIL